MNEKETVIIGGSEIGFDKLTWPVYPDYEIINIYDYVGRKDSNAQAKLYKYMPNFDDCVNNLFDQFVIVPVGKNPSFNYEPLKYKTTIFSDIMKIFQQTDTQVSTDEVIANKALEFVKKYGLLYKTSRMSTLKIQGDEGKHNGSDAYSADAWILEKNMELALGEYTMLMQNFIVLMEEAINLGKGYMAYAYNDFGEMFETFNVLASNNYEFVREQFFDEEVDFAKRDVNLMNNLKKYLPQILSERLAGYLKFISPALLVRYSEEEYYFEPTWHVLDLWTVIIVQIYEYIAKNQTFKKCLFCGRLFASDSPKRKFCPVLMKVNGHDNILENERSYCQNAYAVKKFRNKNQQ